MDNFKKDQLDFTNNYLKKIIENNDFFFVIGPIHNDKLTRQQQNVWSIIFSWEKQDKCFEFLTIRGMSRLLKTSPSNVRRSIKKLIYLGLLKEEIVNKKIFKYRAIISDWLLEDYENSDLKKMTDVMENINEYF